MIGYARAPSGLERRDLEGVHENTVHLAESYLSAVMELLIVISYLRFGIGKTLA